ncbi:hypothetical protein E2562_021996 [Oryza meyeriana var. granulata]|uniref:Uncharacterized protein n=1 Tax=Oryza meyeriana var. granulata TaxID=110450 RepID=A0A6G1ENE6_9ORYZ|nr:hypothetical protein E2562_021996 [Oryza meyeriana var. granulata]
MGREAHRVLDLVLDDVQGILEVADLAEVAKLRGYDGSVRGARWERGSSAGKACGEGGTAPAGEAAPVTSAGLDKRRRRRSNALPPLRIGNIEYSDITP